MMLLQLPFLLIKFNVLNIPRSGLNRDAKQRYYNKNIFALWLLNN
jgi:hypothetical protein